MNISKETKWQLIEWSVYIVCAALGVAIINFALAAMFTAWKVTHHEFFWWTIPYVITGIVIVLLGVLVAIAPHVLVRVDKKFNYRK